jgi:hypothetical protein
MSRAGIMTVDGIVHEGEWHANIADDLKFPSTSSALRAGAARMIFMEDQVNIEVQAGAATIPHLIGWLTAHARGRSVGLDILNPPPKVWSYKASGYYDRPYKALAVLHEHVQVDTPALPVAA